ncbi:MAG: exodeoxyribonuclease VII large subunit [Actinobacteria bacterium]|nr:exodeoxyribonuclease VII large subunit [Actinomycetota bacterium]
MDFSQDIESKQVVYSVAEITQEIKILLESGIPAIWVQGEISNFVHHSSGHNYFSLKDKETQISAVMWRSRNSSLFFTPKNGMKVLAFGAIRVYEKRGTYQLDVQKMIPAGIGELQMAFEQLKQKLQEEGLFDPEFKKPIPELPEKIGIVTSPTGAAVHDLIQVLQRRFPGVEIFLRPAKVQGEGAAQDIACAIEEFNEFGQVDVLIVGRGGGSLEDLWAFNEEVVVRAIFASTIPIISAVGHEIDFTISDFVADLRAPTPSAAAELVVPLAEDLLSLVKNLQKDSFVSVSRRLAELRERLENLRLSYGFRRPVDLILQHRQRLDELVRVNQITMSNKLSSLRTNLQQVNQRLSGLHPESVLKRGYSLAWKNRDHHIIRDAADLAVDESVHIHFYRGGVDAQVVDVNPQEEFEKVYPRNSTNMDEK